MNNRNNLKKSEKPSDRKSNFLNLDDKKKSKEKDIFSKGRNSKLMHKIKQIKKIQLFKY